MPGEDSEIIVENLLALLLRQVILVLTKRRPLPAEAARHPRIEIVIGADLHGLWGRRRRYGSSRIVGENLGDGARFRRIEGPIKFFIISDANVERKKPLDAQTRRIAKA